MGTLVATEIGIFVNREAEDRPELNRARIGLGTYDSFGSDIDPAFSNLEQ